MVIIVMKAGNDSVISFKLIFFTESIINTPTITKAPLVAALGISMKIGERKRDTRNRIPTKNAVTPERPPSAMPLALST